MAFTGQPLAASKALASSAAVRGWDRTVETRPRIPNTAGTAAAHIPQPMQRAPSTCTVMALLLSPGPCPAFFPL